MRHTNGSNDVTGGDTRGTVARRALTIGRVLVAGAVVAAASAVMTTATAPKSVAAIPAYDCRGADLLMTKSDGVYLLNTTTGVATPYITGTQVPNLTVANQVGVSKQGPNQQVIFTTTTGGAINVVEYTLATGNSNPTPTTNGPGGVAGVVNLANGLFYFGSAGGNPKPGSAMINVYDPATDTISPDVVEVPLKDGVGGNGDIAFDSAGNLYIVTSDGTQYWVYLVQAPIPTSGKNVMEGRLIATSAEFPGKGGGVNGIAFGADGYIYTSSGANAILRKFNPLTGAFAGEVSVSGPTDLGSCADPNRIRLFKNLPGGRYNPTDQFHLEISGPGVTLGNQAETEGTEVGLQDQSTTEYAGPLIGLAGTEFTITETVPTSGPGSSTKLENYSTTWTCIDESQGNVVVASGTGTTGKVVLPSTGGVNVKCAFTNIPVTEVKLQKDLPQPRLAATDQFRLAITPGGAPEATTTGNLQGIQTETAVLDKALPGVQYTITEHASGTTLLSNYSTTWSCIDTANGGAAIGAGNGPSGVFTIPTPGGPNRQKVLCTFINTPIISTIIPSKSVSPADGSTVYVGDTVTYTLTFDNPGPTPAQVNYVDDFSGVVDDAEMTELPKLATGTGITVSAPVGGKFSMTGTVPAKSSATVTYKAKVKEDEFRGDNLLLNFLLPPGKPTPNICPDNDPLCTKNPVPEPVVTKAVDPVDGSTVLAGQTLTYTLTFDNTLGKAAAPINWSDNLSDVLDDATIASPPSTSNANLTASAVTNGQFTVTGSLPAGTTTTVTYKVTVKPEGMRGNNDLLNYLFPTGTTPPTTCVVGNPLCTENPVPQPIVTKSADPADGTTVLPGQTVTYTLTFDNSVGKAPATLTWDDDIAGVLDDATLTQPPVASDPGLTATAPTNRGIIKITGTLAAGKKATVTYKVQVKPDGQRGDNILLNYLFPTGTEPPSTCVVGNPLCTAHPVPEPVVSKSVDPLDGSTVYSGQTLTYTLTFSNAKGKGPADIAWDDNMTKVLDDATVTAAPTSSNAALTVSPITNGVFTVRGTLAAGQTVTVTMKVQVNPDGSRGDDDLLNFLMKPGGTLPNVCVVGDPLCTENPVPPQPAIKLDKSVLLVTDTAGNGLNNVGDVVTYAFKVTNTGNVVLTNIVLTDPKLSASPLTCPQTTLKPGESMDCTAPTYTLTAADLAAGRAVNTATVTGKPPVGPNVNSTDDAIVPVNLPPTIPATGGNLPSKMASIAPPLVLAGAALVLLGKRRRSGHAVYFK